MSRPRLPILLTILASSCQAFQLPVVVGGRPSASLLALGKGILEMAEVDAATVFPAVPDESFLGNYEDLVMPGKEGHGYQLILDDDDESFRLYVKQQQQQQSSTDHDSHQAAAAQQRARANIGYYFNRDLVGNVPETTSVSHPNNMMRHNIDYFSSHAVGTTILPDDHKATLLNQEVQQRMAREHMGFFSTPFLATHCFPKDDMVHEEARARARENIDFFTLKEHYAVPPPPLNKMEEARKVARNNIDFFAAKSTFATTKQVNNDSKERATARLNIGYFS